MLCWGENPRHPNKNSAEVSPLSTPPMEKVGGDIFLEGKHRRPSLSNTFIFRLSIYLFIFNFFFFWKECQGMRKSLLRAVFCREGGSRHRVLSPSSTSEVLPQPQVDLCEDNLHFPKPLFVLKKETRWSPEAGSSPGLCHPLPPSSSSFSPACLVWFRIFFGLSSWWAFFSRDPCRLPTSTVNFLGEDEANTACHAGTGKAPRAHRIRIAVTQKRLRHFLKL